MKIQAFSGVALIAVFSAAAEAQTTFTAFGANAAAIQTEVDNFRTALGTNNGGTAGSQGTGRRELSWDGVSDAQAAGAQIPGDFFNVVSTRGLIYSSVGGGTGFQVSADGTNPATTAAEFGNINSTFGTAFEPFSTERLFTPLGNNVFDVTFAIPGSSTPAATNAFGAVFSDVDTESTSQMEFFRDNQSLGVFTIPAAAGDGGFSFVGVQFPDSVVTRVRITAGEGAISASDDVTQTPGNDDVVALDDFIYGEPVPREVTTEGIAGRLASLRAAVDTAGLGGKTENKMLKDLDKAVAAADKADQASKPKQVNKNLKKALKSLAKFEAKLDSVGAVVEFDEAERTGFAITAAEIGVDLASLMAPI